MNEFPQLTDTLYFLLQSQLPVGILTMHSERPSHITYRWRIVNWLDEYELTADQLTNKPVELIATEITQIWRRRYQGKK